MIDDCNINNLAKNQVSAVFNSRAIRRRVSSKFIEIGMGRHVGAHLDGHQHGGRKPTETSVTEFYYKSVNLSLEELKTIKIILFLIQEPVQIAKFPEISPEISHTTRPSCKCRVTQKLRNSSITYRKTKNPFGTKNRLNIRFQLLLYLTKVKYQ